MPDNMSIPYLPSIWQPLFQGRADACLRLVATGLGTTEETRAMPRWRKHSIFGDGPRVRLDRNGRARFRFLTRAHRSAGRLTADQVDVAEVLVGALGDDGRLDLAHATIAERALCHVATVKRALVRLRALGLVDWVRRLVRGPGTSWRCEQGSNAYVLRTPACEAQAARPVRKKDISYCRGLADQPTSAETKAAQAALAWWRAEMEARLLTKSGGGPVPAT
jgi:hypothetical protein